MKKEMPVKPTIVELEKMIQNHNEYFINPKGLPVSVLKIYGYISD